ncbi:formylglycine-generating enzyme family protein [Verrucomicrobiota bacterium]
MTFSSKAGSREELGEVHTLEVFGRESIPDEATAHRVIEAWGGLRFASQAESGSGVTVRVNREDAGLWSDPHVRAHYPLVHYDTDCFRWDLVTVDGREYWLLALLTPKRSSPVRSTPSQRTVDLAPSVAMVFCWIPPTTASEWRALSGGSDTFMMGSPSVESARGDDECLHRVRLSKGFWLAKSEVTRRQWEAVMGSPPLHKGALPAKAPRNRNDFAEHPVDYVTWADCQGFCRRLNATMQLGVGELIRLPTEAEWEYACRAGTRTPHAGDLCRMAWYMPNSGAHPLDEERFSTLSDAQQLKDIETCDTHPVCEKDPNAWGLYDMHGNASEWCHDSYRPYGEEELTDPMETTGSIRVIRGGSALHRSSDCRSAARSHAPQSGWALSQCGFRCAIATVGIPFLSRACRRTFFSCDNDCTISVSATGVEFVDKRKPQHSFLVTLGELREAAVQRDSLTDIAVMLSNGKKLKIGIGDGDTDTVLAAISALVGKRVP